MQSMEGFLQYIEQVLSSLLRIPLLVFNLSKDSLAIGYLVTLANLLNLSCQLLSSPLKPTWDYSLVLYKCGSPRYSLS